MQLNVTCNKKNFKSFRRKKLKDVKTRLKAIGKREMKGSLIRGI
jgi:hypothetical protein